MASGPCSLQRISKPNARNLALRLGGITASYSKKATCFLWICSLSHEVGFKSYDREARQSAQYYRLAFSLRYEYHSRKQHRAGL